MISEKGRVVSRDVRSCDNGSAAQTLVIPQYSPVVIIRLRRIYYACSVLSPLLRI
jgi:hypothetical protein